MSAECHWKPCGKLVVAATDGEPPGLKEIQRRAEMEPYASGAAHRPRRSPTSSRSAMLAGDAHLVTVGQQSLGFDHVVRCGGCSWIAWLSPRVQSAPRDTSLASGAGNGGRLDDFKIDRMGPVTALRNATLPTATSALAIAEHVVDRMDLRP